jgi:hypothetical protein
MGTVEEWHDPAGPEPPNFRVGKAQDAIDFVRRGYIAILDQRVEEAAKAIGMDEAQINELLGRSSQG